MALTNKSLFLYGFQVTETNRSIDFRSVASETIRQASLNLGFYSLTSLATEISRALHAVDALRTFTVSVDRTVLGGIENRVTISTNGSHLELLGATGPRAASTSLPLIGFNAADYTGNTTYTGSLSAGTVLIPGGTGIASENGYNYSGPDLTRSLYGAVNVSASGIKEAIVFGIQKFFQVEYRYQSYTKIVDEWVALLTWCIQQRQIEFTPDISDPSTFYVGTLDKSESDGKGLGYKFTEMLPIPNLYRTGLMTFRVQD